MVGPHPRSGRQREADLAIEEERQSQMPEAEWDAFIREKLEQNQM
jgi:hypothetical protein